MSASRLWSSGGLVSMLVLSLILLHCQASLASSTVKYGRSGHFGGKLQNLKDSVCDPLISGDKTRCGNEGGQKFPGEDDESVCKKTFYKATCLTPAACQKCPGDSLLIWIQDQQTQLDNRINANGDCLPWVSLCPHLSCPTTPTPTVPNTTTPMATTEALITPKAPFPYWVIGVVALVLFLLVGGFLCWKFVFKSSSSHKAKHSHGSSGPKRGATSSGLKKGSFSAGHAPSPKKSTTGGHHQSSDHHQAAAKRGKGGHSSSTVAQHVPTKVGPKLVRPKTIKIKHIPGKNSLEVVKQQDNSAKSNELIILDFRKSIKWQ